MERTTNLKLAKNILGKNFIGHKELLKIVDKTNFFIPSEIPEIPYDLKEIEKDYILILGLNKFLDNKPINIITLRDKFGIDSQLNEPCFYNQDWYVNEDFVKKTLELKWYVVRKQLINESKGKNPNDYINLINFPSAILCAYTFFSYYLLNNEKLWDNEYVWCNDTDHNTDRIYVGCYTKLSGMNKNGFEVHRHLSIKSHYGIIELK